MAIGLVFLSVLRKYVQINKTVTVAGIYYLLSRVTNSCPEVACTTFGYFSLKFQRAIALGKVAMRVVNLNYIVCRAVPITAKWEDMSNDHAPPLTRIWIFPSAFCYAPISSLHDITVADFHHVIMRQFNATSIQQPYGPWVPRSLRAANTIALCICHNVSLIQTITIILT